MAETINQSSESILTKISVLEERVRALTETVDDRYRYYISQFKAAEVAVSAALIAQDKLTVSSFASSEKAIAKAEEAQREYNVRSNEFRGQLDDQAKTLLPRAEANTQFNALSDKIEDVKEQVGKLREFRGEFIGKEVKDHTLREQQNWNVGNIISFAGVLFAVLLGATSLVIVMWKH